MSACLPLPHCLVHRLALSLCTVLTYLLHRLRLLDRVRHNLRDSPSRAPTQMFLVGYQQRVRDSLTLFKCGTVCAVTCGAHSCRCCGRKSRRFCCVHRTSPRDTASIPLVCFYLIYVRVSMFHPDVLAAPNQQDYSIIHESFDIFSIKNIAAWL